MTFDLDKIDVTLPDVILKIGGKDRHLAFDYNAIVTVEKTADINLLTDTFNASFGTIGSLLYAALLNDDPTITMDEVGSWVNFKSAPIIYQAIMSAWLGSIPAPQDETSGEDQATVTENPVA